MASSLMRKIFGSRNDRQVKKYRKIVTRINGLEDEYKSSLMSNWVLKQRNFDSA